VAKEQVFKILVKVKQVKEGGGGDKTASGGGDGTPRGLASKKRDKLSQGAWGCRQWQFIYESRADVQGGK